MAEGVTVANAFVQVMPSMEGAGTSITSALTPQLTSAGDKAAAGFGTAFVGKAGALLKAAGGIFASFLAVGAMKDAFENVEEGFNNVKIATGATGEAAEQLKGVYLDVSKHVTGSFEDIGSAVGELNTRFGLQGDELEKASEAAMKYAKVTGQDATTAIQDVSRMMNNAGIPADQYAQVLDKLTVAGQAAGIDVGKLATSVNDNAASFKEMGLSTDDAIAMLANFEKTGANTSAILAGMKKGVAEWSKEGVSAKEGFAQFVQGVQDGTVSSADAIDIFGARAGVTMYDAAQKGQLNFEEMYDSIVNSSDGALESVYQSTLTAQEKFDLLGQNLQVGFFQILEPIVDAILPYVDILIDGITQVIDVFVSTTVPVIEQFIGYLTPVIDAVLPELQQTFDEVMTAIGEIVGMVWPVIEQVIVTVMGVVAQVIKTTWPVIMTIISTAMNVVKKVIETVWPSIERIISQVMSTIGQFMEQNWPKISQIITSAMDVIKSVIDTAWPVIEAVISTVMSAVEGVISTAWPVIEGIVTTAVDAIKSAIEGIDSVVGVVRDIFESVQSFIEDPIGEAKNFIEGIINDIENAFAWMNIDIPAPKLPHINWNWHEFQGPFGSISIPEFTGIDWYAKGGMVDGAQLIGAGEKGAELIWPSYDPYLTKYADAIADRMGGRGGVDIHDCTFNVRNDGDIRRIANELNQLINRQTVGGYA